jgi:Tfp pilus assembly protein PilF
LSLLFAVHPVLTQAVAWIPGRNDMLLMIFFLSSFILLLQHIEKPSPWRVALHSLLFLLALFTKETAVIIPVIMAAVALIHMHSGWRKLLLPAAGWVMAVVVWFIVRSSATLTKSWISPPDMIRAGIDRLGVILQYLGKIFFPFNLAVFPEAQDITLWWGVLALAGVVALVIWSKSYRKPLTWLGIAWFLIFLLPVLIVPKSLNDQVFEHRLYLPLVGILLMLSQSWPFGSFTPPKTRIMLVSAIVLVFSVVCIVRTAYFSDAMTFWTKAVEGSPHSAYAKALLGTKTEDAAEREKIFRQAWALDPDLKNLNFYLGKALFDQKKDSAEYYLRREVAHNEVPDAYFMLAQIAFLRENYDSAGILLEKVIELNPLDAQANHNLVLLYWQHGKPEKSRETLRRMQEKGMAVDNDLLQMVSGK